MQARRLEAAGIAGIAGLAWAAGHFSGSDPAVYPAGLLLAALAAAALVAAAAGQGIIAAITSWRPLRWTGIRSYGIYLWHWPVIALGTVLANRGPAAGSPWLWLVEIGVTIALAAASWRYIETPVLRDGLRTTVRRWASLVAEASRRPAGTLGRAVPVTVATVTAITVAVAGYGIARPPAPAAPGGLLQQVASGQRVIAASQATQAAGYTRPAWATSRFGSGRAGRPGLPRAHRPRPGPRRRSRRAAAGRTAWPAAR